jgi:hypothetical protein
MAPPQLESHSPDFQARGYQHLKHHQIPHNSTKVNVDSEPKKSETGFCRPTPADLDKGQTGFRVQCPLDRAGCQFCPPTEPFLNSYCLLTFCLLVFVARFRAADMALARILDLELLSFLWALIAAVVFQLLTRKINLAGLLSRKDGSNGISAIRVQLLITTIAASAHYLIQLTNGKVADAPDISNRWLYLFGGSSGIYTLGKGWAFWNESRRTCRQQSRSPALMQ